jgi:hypothetical protein
MQSSRFAMSCMPQPLWKKPEMRSLFGFSRTSSSTINEQTSEIISFMAELREAESPIFRLDSAASASLMELVPCALPELTSLQSALQCVGVLPLDEKLASYEDVSNWRRGGAETYVSDFRVAISSDSGLRNLHVIAKAIVKWATPPERVLQVWLHRQRRLEEFGATVAQIFGSAAGIIYQKFIPFAFADWFRSVDPSSRGQWMYRLKELAARVDAAGFAPVEFVNNLRTDGVRLFIVDVGADLGGFQNQETGSATCELVETWLRAYSGKGDA